MSPLALGVAISFVAWVLVPVLIALVFYWAFVR